MLRLVSAFDCDSLPRVVYLSEQTTTFGRDAPVRSGIINLIADGFELNASRVQARIVQLDGSYLLLDGSEIRPSSNGTFVDGVAIDPRAPHTLRDGEVISFSSPWLDALGNERTPYAFIFDTMVSYGPVAARLFGEAGA